MLFLPKLCEKCYNYCCLKDGGNLTLVIVISILTILSMLICIIKFPKIKIKSFSIDTFWIAPLIGAFLLLIFKVIPLNKAVDGLLNSGSINPIKIIILFFSMTFLSIVLDELNFFEVIANFALKKVKNNQFALFIIIYVLTSFLTIFTSNDIIVLTFTPFIIFFSKNAKISPIPYLVSEFIAANTWSMLLIIGNPTNIYLATSCNIDFFEYLSHMALPTILAGTSSFLLLFLIFRKKLKTKLNIEISNVSIKSKPMLIINLVCLILCTIILSISSYIDIEMYLVSLVFSLILFVVLLIYSIIKKNFTILVNSLKRIPYLLLPFILSMFIIVLSLKEVGLTSIFASVLSGKYHLIIYGIVSTLTCNFINNIPVSVLFSEIINPSSLDVYASIIGTNIGAFLTPIGALAGIMWLSILKEHKVNFSFLTFTKYGIMVALPTLMFALVGLLI